MATAFGALALLITAVLDAWVELDVLGELGVLGLEVDGWGGGGGGGWVWRWTGFGRR